MKKLQIVAPDKKAHTAQLIDLMAKVFPEPGYFDFRDHCRQGYLLGGHYDWDASRIGLIGERIVTHYGVWDYQMRIGSARVRVGGIGGVATHGDYRKKGLMATTAQATIESMRRYGYDMTVLFGIRDFYHRFGYVRAWPGTTWYVNAEDLPSQIPPGRIRKFVPRYRADLTRIYNRHFAGITGTAVRPTYLKGRRRPPWEGQLWANTSGDVVGYVVVRPRRDHLECTDCAGPATQVLGLVRKVARRLRRDEVRFHCLPHNTQVAKLLRRGRCRCELRYSKSGGAMIRTVNLTSTLGKMAGELSRRLAESAFASWRGELLICDAREKVKLSIGRSGVRVGQIGTDRSRGAKVHNVIRGGEHIAQLLIGTDEPGEIIEAGRIRLTGDARKLIEVLFGHQHPMLSAPDAF